MAQARTIHRPAEAAGLQAAQPVAVAEDVSDLPDAEDIDPAKIVNAVRCKTGWVCPLDMRRPT